LSVYCGPDAEFGTKQDRLWVDFTKDEGVRREFKKYLEDKDIKKAPAALPRRPPAVTRVLGAPKPGGAPLAHFTCRCGTTTGLTDTC